MRYLMILLYLIFFQAFLIGQESEISFGSINVQIDSGEEGELNIRTAILYENADVDFDTALQIQDGDGSKVLYYPQIIDGSNEILRLIMAPENNQEDFYDVIFNLGDSLEDRIVYENAESKVFFNYKGKLDRFKRYTKNLNGKFLFLKEASEKEMISGEVNTTFQMPLDENSTQFSTVTLKGTFDVYLGEFRAVSLATGPQLQKKKTKYMKNLVIAMMMAAIGYFIFLGQ